MSFSIGLFFLDVSNPARPVTLSVDWERGAGRIAVAGEHAYLACGSSRRVLDVSPPASPTVLAELGTGEPVQGMQAAGDRLYVVSGNWERHGTLRIYDTSDLTAPQLLGTLEFDGTALDLDVVGITPTWPQPMPAWSWWMSTIPPRLCSREIGTRRVWQIQIGRICPARKASQLDLPLTKRAAFFRSLKR